MIDQFFKPKVSIFDKACTYKGVDIRQEYIHTKPEERPTKKKQLQQEFAKNAMKLLEDLEYQPIPSYDFDLTHFATLATPKLQLHDKAQQGKDIFLDAMKTICDFSSEVLKNQDHKPYSYLKDYLKIISLAATIAKPLQYFGIACYALAWLLEEGPVEIAERYVKRSTKAEKIETDMKILKLALEEIKAKFVSIHHILLEVSSRQMSDDKHYEMLIISLLQPCEEIEQRFRMKDGIFKQFSFYSVQVMTQFFKLYLSLLSILKTEFGMNFENKIQTKIKEYPELLEDYIDDITRKRIKSFIPENYTCEFCAKIRAYNEGWVKRVVGALFLSFAAPIRIPFIVVYAMARSEALVNSQDILLKDDRTKAVVVKFCENEDGLFDEDFRKELSGPDTPFKLYYKEKFSSCFSQLQECISGL